MNPILRVCAAALALAASVALPASAQVVRDQLVAQSNFVPRTGQALPQISIVVRADFVLFQVSYETATRSPDARQAELEKVFKAVTDKAAKTDGMTVEVGTPGNSAAIETAAIKELIKESGGDRSAIELVLKVQVREKDTFDAIRARTEKFVNDMQMPGRVEAVIGDSQFLGVSEPKKHRETLIKAIAADTTMLRTAFGLGATPVSVSLTGLESRVLTRPAGPLDLEIYIPYSMSLVSGQK